MTMNLRRCLHAVMLLPSCYADVMRIAAAQINAWEQRLRIPVGYWIESRDSSPLDSYPCGEGCE